MKFSEEELGHLVFLSQVVLEGRKREMMAETIQCLLYLVKSLQQVELPDDVTDHIRELIRSMEERLKQENDRMQEIHYNLSHPGKRRPFG